MVQITWSVAKSPRVAEQCDVNIQSINESIDNVTQSHPTQTVVSEGIILLHDNVRPHTAQVTQELLRRFRWEIWSHSPYSSDLAGSAVKTSAETWLNGQGPDFYQDGLSKLVLRNDKCLNRLGDYVEK
ncbi:UNVERIFIED_CONTAM: Histone-lysine N-methyltransferase SETMAR [Trichonephila clavipes]